MFVVFIFAYCNFVLTNSNLKGKYVNIINYIAYERRTTELVENQLGNSIILDNILKYLASYMHKFVPNTEQTAGVF